MKGGAKMEQSEQLNTLALQLPKTRSNKRAKLIKDISGAFIEQYRNNGFVAFPREHLNFLLDGCDSVRERAKQQTITSLIEYMTSAKLIKEYRIVRAIYTFRKKPLNSYDYGSYSVMMRKNGYKRNFYVWKYIRGSFPKKIKIGTLNIGEKIPENWAFDFSEIQSYKSREQQGIYTNSNKSECRDKCGYSEKRVYKIL